MIPHHLSLGRLWSTHGGLAYDMHVDLECNLESAIQKIVRSFSHLELDTSLNYP